jgi:serine/threonine protein kinase
MPVVPGHASDPPLSFHSRYVLEKKLGQGAFSKVYAGSSAFGDDVAIKITDLRKPSSRRGAAVKYGSIDPEQEEAVQMEVEVLKHIRDKDYCVQYHEECREGVLSYIVMERCERSLRQAFESLPALNERTLAPFVRGMLRALEVIHDARVVHRDIKPDNFLCSGEYMTVKLCDFGLAKIMTSATRSSCTGVFGTAPFMSPEMIGNRGYGVKTDLWSVGVIVYVMLFGRFPYEPERHNHNAMKKAIHSGIPAPSYRLTKEERTQKPCVSKDAKAFMQELLDRNPVVRPSAKRALNMHWMSLPDSLETRSTRDLTDTFQKAKRIGAFHPRAQVQDDDPLDFIDMMLKGLQAGRAGRKPGFERKISPSFERKISPSFEKKSSLSFERATLPAGRHISRATVSTTASSPMSSREFSDGSNETRVASEIPWPSGIVRSAVKMMAPRKLAEPEAEPEVALQFGQAWTRGPVIQTRRQEKARGYSIGSLLGNIFGTF